MARLKKLGLTAEIAVDGDGRTYAGMGVDFQDFDNDGLPDLVFTNLANQKYALYKNNGDGSFSYSTYTAGLAPITLLHSGWGIRFLDYDNDGRKDLLVAQGHDLDTVELNFPQLHYREPMLLARNMGHGTFVDVSARNPAPRFTQPWVSRGMAVGDLDNDGRLDAIVTTNGGPAHLLHNETTNPHPAPRPTTGSPSCSSATPPIETPSAPKSTSPAPHTGTQLWTVSTAGSYLSSNDKRAHFGLGPDPTATTIDIRWPSGITQHLTNIPANQQLKIDEPVH